MEIRSTPQALEEWQRLAGMFPGLIALAQDMIEISSIEVAADAAEKRLTTANASLANARQKLVDVENECTERLQRTETAVALKIKESDTAIGRTRAEADTAIDKLKAAAQANLDSANAEADRIVLVARNAQAAIASRTADVEETLQRLEAEIVEQQALLDTAKSEMQDIQDAKTALAAKLG